ncbi:MAG: gliding motility-associated C-terminal domain-containing protein [Bacteroidetes bacterium]|nr:gliding motility-associated C-terminal domain-containing protein [Bacteroidota bacterium]
MKNIFKNQVLKKALLLSALCCYHFLHAQNFTNKGVEFWAGYGTHLSMYNPDGSINPQGGSQEMVFYFSGNRDAVITIDIPSIGWTKTYNYSANSMLTSDVMPKSGGSDSRILSEGLTHNGIHITSTQEIAAYCHIYDSRSSSTTLLTPINSLGQFYTSLNFTQQSAEKNAAGYCFVVATEDSTQVEITPSVNTLTHAAGVPFLVSLNKGDIYNVFSAQTGTTNGLYTAGDLTGTSIRTVNIDNNIPCRKIAVFSGSSNVSVNCAGGKSTSDLIFQQILPNGTWGNKFFLIPTKQMGNNYFRVLVSDASTNVSLNGVRLSNLINGTYYEFTSDEVSQLTANLPVMVAQYITTTGECGNNNAGNGDPEMVYITPTSMSINSATFESPSVSNIAVHFVNVVMQTTDTASFTLDGVLMGYQFKPIAQNPDYSYARFDLSSGRHNIQTDSGFNAVIYGYGPEESYGYNPGFSSKKLSNFLTVYNPYATPADLITCRNTTFQLSLNIVYQPEEFTWSFSNAGNLTPNTDVFIKNPVPDSTYTINNTTYYRYKLPINFNFTTIDSFHVHILSLAYIQDGCTNTHEMDFDVNVVERPVAQWSLDYNHCSNDSLYFKDSTLAFGFKPVQWKWNFGDGSIDSTQNVWKKYATYGDYNVSLRTITNIGCFDDTMQLISRDPIPISAFDYNGFYCLNNNTINFTDQSTIANPGIIAGWLWDFGDGNMDSTENPEKVYQTADTFSVKLITRSNRDCYDTSAAQQVIIYPNPLIDGPDQVNVFLGDTVRLPMTYIGTGLTYLWTPVVYLNAANLPQPISKPPVNVLYTVNVNGVGNCYASRQIFVQVLKEFKIPNAFSPNGDGINDKWIINGLETFTGNTVDVFNRYGQVVFHADGYDNSGKVWDGKMNGKPLPLGTYYYIVNPKSDFMQKRSGWVVLLR